MKSSNKKPTAKKMTFTPINKPALQQIKGGASTKSESIEDDDGDVD